MLGIDLKPIIEPVTMLAIALTDLAQVGKDLIELEREKMELEAKGKKRVA